MYASKCFRLLSVCSKSSYVVSRQIVSSESLKPLKVAVVDSQKCKFLAIKNRQRFFGCLLSTSSSPESTHNVSTEKVKKKRRRILSDSSDDAANTTQDDIEK